MLRNSPAAKAGIRRGDIVRKWNGQEIRNRAELSLAVVRSKIGSQATVELWRDGKPLELTVTVGVRPPFRRR